MRLLEPRAVLGLCFGAAEVYRRRQRFGSRSSVSTVLSRRPAPMLRRDGQMPMPERLVDSGSTFGCEWIAA
ncbi:MAG: hypothetical protein ACRDRD_17785, partial [Pseudonocardiaceae bacterium]